MDGDWRARYHPEQQMAARVAMSSTLTAENTGFIATVLTSITVMELPVVGVLKLLSKDICSRCILEHSLIY